MTTISVSIDEELLEWLDQLIECGIINSRSEAIRGGIYSYIREKLGISSRADLRSYLASQQKEPFQSGVEVIRSVRQDE